MAFELAEREPYAARRRALMTFVIIGGGPTGVELAGTLGELTHRTLKNHFRAIDPAETNIFFSRRGAYLLAFPPICLPKRRQRWRMWGTVRTRTLVIDIRDSTVTMRSGEAIENLQARTIVWTAGVKASVIGEVVAKHTGVTLDRAGRVQVEPNLTIPGHPEIFVIGDLAHFSHQDGKPLPAWRRWPSSKVAMSASSSARGCSRDLPPFRYHDKGKLVIIVRNAASPISVSGMRMASRHGYYGCLCISTI